MRKVISNTTPILSLLKIQQLDVLKKLYKEIIIPEAVYNEVEMGKHKVDYCNLKEINWINITKVQNPKSKESFVGLDDGESEVLVLSNEIDADLVIIDEILGRKYAKQLGLKLTGTLGVLLKAKMEGYISSLKSIVLELESKGIWLHPKLITKVLEMANEK